MLQRAAVIMEKAYGANDTRLGSVLNSLGNVERQKNNNAAAERYYRRALEILEKTYGPDDPRLATQLTNLGRLLVTHPAALTTDGDHPLDAVRRADVDRGLHRLQGFVVRLGMNDSVLERHPR